VVMMLMLRPERSFRHGRQGPGRVPHSTGHGGYTRRISKYNR
jgi:hypothetical protein